MKFDLKATMYDIFGYLFPGVIVTYWILYELKNEQNNKLWKFGYENIIRKNRWNNTIFDNCLFCRALCFSSCRNIIWKYNIWLYNKKIERLIFKAKISDNIVKKVEKK